jgi:transcriptional regulator with XRE-family HTH domain
MNLGSLVRQRRKALGLTQEELARRASLSLGVVHRLEAGRIRDPHYSTLEAMAGALGVDVGELLRDTYPLGRAPSGSGQPETLAEQLVEQIMEVQNRYRDRRFGLELLCEHWERQLDSLGEDLTRETLDEMSLVGSYVMDFFVQAAVDETVEIWVVLSSATPGRAESRVVVDSAAIATAIRSSSMKPVLDRWERLGGEIYRRGVERFGEDAARNVIRLGDPARPTASVDELALRRAEKLQQRRAS